MTELFLHLSHGVSASWDTLALLNHHWVHFANDTVVLAQSTDADLVKDIQEAFKKFVETGQVWALLIGLIVGYFIRGFTFYG